MPHVVLFCRGTEIFLIKSERDDRTVLLLSPTVLPHIFFFISPWYLGGGCIQDLKNEARMFALLDTLPDLSVVSVGHRPSLVQFHDTKLSLANKGFSIESTGSGREGRGTAVEEYEKERNNGRGIAPIVAQGLDRRDGGR